jgi:AcrR family transcriptional regulator
MAETLVQRDFRAITVRELSKSAGVSTRTFYQCYAGKDECFLGLQQQMARHLLLALASRGRVDGESSERIGQEVEALCHELVRDPARSRLLLLDANTVGRRAQVQAQRLQGSLESRMVDCLDGTLEESAISRAVASGVVSGLLGVARSLLLTGQLLTLPAHSDELTKWACACLDPSLAQLSEIEVKIEQPVRPAHPRIATNTDDAALLMTAAAKLAATEETSGLSVRTVLDTAGLPRRRFDANFESLEECIAEALSTSAHGLTARAMRAVVDHSNATHFIARFVLASCEEIERDPVFTSLCFGCFAMSDLSRIAALGSLMTSAADLIAGALERSLSVDVDRTKTEASVAACWGVIHKRITVQGPEMIANVAPVLTYLVLAPAIGRRAAIHARSASSTTCTTQPGRSV